MQSFLLKTIYCVLVINITFCWSCFNPLCRAGCYLKQGGLDYGYCEDGHCKCSLPIIYVFDGIGRDLSDDYIKHSLDNDNLIQNSMLDSKNGNGYAVNSKKMVPIIDDTNSISENQKTIPIEKAQPEVTPSTPPKKIMNSNIQDTVSKTDGSNKSIPRNSRDLGANGKANTNLNQSNQLNKNDGKNIPNKKDGLNLKPPSKPINKQKVNEDEHKQEIIVEVTEETVEETDEDVSEYEEESDEDADKIQKQSIPIKISKKVSIEKKENAQVQKPEKAPAKKVKNVSEKVEPKEMNPENNLPPIEEDDEEWSGSESVSYSSEENQPVINAPNKK